MIGNTLLRGANVLIVGYLLLISMRIVLSWFRGPPEGRAVALLHRVTDPYLGLFRRIPLLRHGAFDFSPIAAVLVLVVILDLVNELLYYGQITLGFVLASLVGALWYGASFLLLLLAVVGALRLVGFGLRSTRNPALWRTLDMIVQPVVGWVSRLLSLGPRMGYIQCLALVTALLLTVWFLGGMGARVLIRALRSLPI
jgi:YggT family protein